MQSLKLVKIPFRGHQIIIAQEENQTGEFTVTLQKPNEATVANTRIEQLNGHTGSDLIGMMEKMSLLIDTAEHGK